MGFLLVHGITLVVGTNLKCPHPGIVFVNPVMQIINVSNGHTIMVPSYGSR